ncbi:MAG: AAA family ATPase, partial [Sulfuricurvum sp.]
MSKMYYLTQSNEVELFKAAAGMNLPVLIKGPTGCGKTRFVEAMGEELGRDVYTVVCHDDLSAADLVGRHLIDENGTYWQDGPLTKAVRNGGICYLDEIIEARKDTTVVLHSLADYRRVLPIDRTGEVITAHPDFMLVVSYNPGYQNVLKGMKPSTKQRFISLSFNYPKAEIETEIIVKESGVDKKIAQKLVSIAAEIRQ